MLKNYLIVDKNVLPEVFLKVIKIKQLMEEGQFDNISDAAKSVGLSRSAYYKYKDHVFEPDNVTLERKALITFTLSHEKGLLSQTLAIFAKFDCSVITINQNVPINQKANVMVSVDISEMNQDIELLIQDLQTIKGISRVRLISIE